MANNSVNTLPHDILIDILLLSSSLHHLFSLITTSKHIYSTFQHRRSLILSRVFERQIATQLSHIQTLYPTSRLGSPGAVYTSQVLSIARRVEHTISQCSNNTEDMLLLDATAWRAFKQFDSRLGVLRLVSTGMKTVERCIALGRRDLGMRYVREICGEPSEGQEQSSSEQKQKQQLRLHFAQIFDEAGMHREARELSVQCHSVSVSRCSTSAVCATDEALARLGQMWQSKSTVLRTGGYKEDKSKSIECSLRNVAWTRSLHAACCDESGYVGSNEQLVGLGPSLIMTV